MLPLALSCDLTRLGCDHYLTLPRLERLWDAIDGGRPNELTSSVIGHLDNP